MGEQYTSGATKDRFTWLQTDKDTYFTTAILQNAMDLESITNILPSNKVEIHEIVIESDQQLEYDLYFFNASSGDDTDLDVDAFIDDVNMNLVTAGRQIGGAGQWRLGSRLDGPIKYEDKDGTFALHIGLIPRTGAKNAGATGEVVIKLAVTPSF